MKRIQRQILRASNLRLTSSRSSVLGLFLNNPRALSYSDIEKLIGHSHDRVTIYRTLKSFLDKGIVHKILDDSGGLKYGLCSEVCVQSSHHHEHVHFKCTRCDQTECLDAVAVPAITLPNGYKPVETNLLVQGICANCR